MPTLKVAPGLYQWKVTLADGTVRFMTASSLESITGILTSAVVKAERGNAVDGLVPAPTLTTLTPPSAKIGDANFTLHVAGTGFREGDAILWNGSPETTTFVSATELTTGVNMATAEFAMPIPVAVRTVTGMDSNILTFDLQPAAR